MTLTQLLRNDHILKTNSWWLRWVSIVDILRPQILILASELTTCDTR